MCELLAITWKLKKEFIKLFVTFPAQKPPLFESSLSWSLCLIYSYSVLWFLLWAILASFSWWHITGGNVWRHAAVAHLPFWISPTEINNEKYSTWRYNVQQIWLGAQIKHLLTCTCATRDLLYNVQTSISSLLQRSSYLTCNKYKVGKFLSYDATCIWLCENGW